MSFGLIIESPIEIDHFISLTMRCFVDIPHFSKNPISHFGVSPFRCFLPIPSGDVIEGDFRMVIEGDFLSFLAAVSTFHTQLAKDRGAWTH